MNANKKETVILSYGMGVDSTAILVEWLRNPASRDFDLKDLIVVTAQVGHEFADTKALVERHLLPLMREHGVRFVQLSRAGASENDGITVHADTTAPKTLYTDAASWTLYDEMIAAGTVPQMRSGCRLCSVKFKGFPLDKWLAENVTGAYRHVMGFNADEMFRVERDSSYSTTERKSEYPLVAWGWGREKCEQYLAEWAGEPWAKSCCSFCPFSGGRKAERDAYIARLAKYPEVAAAAIRLERVSVSLNPRQTLYIDRSYEEMLAGSGIHGATFAALDELLGGVEWTLYHVRRGFSIGRDKNGQQDPSIQGPASRDVAAVVHGTREDMGRALASQAVCLGSTVEVEGGVARVWVSRKGQTFPCREELFVAVPGRIEDKKGPGFDARWAAAAPAPRQLTLF
jgi:hypothetical protein